MQEENTSNISDSIKSINEQLLPYLENVVAMHDKLALANWQYYKKRGELQGFTDSDGYPDTALLMLVQKAPWNKLSDTFQIMKKYWWNSDTLFRTDVSRDEISGETKRMLYLSTGGWSGNEDLIKALQENKEVWNMIWYASQVGGHHAFMLKGWILNGQSSETTA